MCFVCASYVRVQGRQQMYVLLYFGVVMYNCSAFFFFFDCPCLVNLITRIFDFFVVEEGRAIVHRHTEV